MAELMSSQEENSEQMLHPHVGVKKKKTREEHSQYDIWETDKLHLY